MDLLKGKKVLVTGGSRGIGRSISKTFANNGAQVIFTYYKKRDIANETLSKLSGEGHQCLELDLRNDEQTEKAVIDAITIMDGLDILINNAGIFIDHPIDNMSFREWKNSWQLTIDTNLIGPANVCFYSAKHFIKEKKGKIINISSRGAYRGEPNAPAYGASKAGLNSLSQSLAVALAPYNIFVGAVAPGFVETDMTNEILSGPEGKSIINQSPMKRAGKPEEIANAVMMLSIDGIDYASGTVIDLNGASYLR
tara:strand:+ start:12850 stop:13608 length:759 start_codon:yes stop_codon:yes gene_type:complete